MKFQGKISYKPSRPTDDIPWLAWLYVDGEKTNYCRWNSSRREAVEALAEMQYMYLTAIEEEMIDLPEIDPEPRRSVA